VAKVTKSGGMRGIMLPAFVLLFSFGCVALLCVWEFYSTKCNR